MATWYVRKTGSNSNAGTSAAAAWLTIGHALASGSGVAAGDSVFVGAGVYRETVTVGISGSSGGGSINLIGDVDGAQTGDAGEVRVTNYLTNDTTAATATAVLNVAAQSYLAFSLLTLVSGSSTAAFTGSGASNVSITDCTLLGIASAVLGWTGPAGVASSFTVDRCTVMGLGSSLTPVAFSLSTTASGSTDYDALIVVRNSLILTLGTSAQPAGISVAATGTNTYHPGGVRVYNCTVCGSSGVNCGTATYLSTSIPCEVHNSVLFAINGLNAATSGQIIESYNLIYAGTPRTNVAAGTGSVSGGTCAPLFEIGQSYKWGAGAARPFMAPTANSPSLGFGSGGTGGSYPTVDWMNRPRPSGGSSANYAAGYLERHDFAVQDTSIYNDAPSSGELVGPGDQFIQVPVNSGSSTISIYLRYDSYGGSTLPSATLLTSGELGIATQTVTCTSAASGAFQQLTFSPVSASKAGWVTLQVTSYDTNGTGTVHFDTLAVA
jgi:hypothetical protein